MPMKMLFAFLPLLLLLVGLFGLIVCRLKMDSAKHALLSADQREQWAKHDQINWGARLVFQFGYAVAGLIFIFTGWTVPTAVSAGWYLALGIITVVSAGLACARPETGLPLEQFPAPFVRRILRWYRLEAGFALLIGLSMLLLAADSFCLK